MEEMTICGKLFLLQTSSLSMCFKCPDHKKIQENGTPRNSVWLKELNANSSICSLKTRRRRKIQIRIYILQIKEGLSQHNFKDHEQKLIQLITYTLRTFA